LAGLIPEGCGVFTFGSFARREASQESDIDYIIVSKEGFGSEHDLKPFVDEVDVALKSVVAVAPAQNGPFGKHVSINEMLTNLGGENDGNENITRRLLLLLEGDWLSNKECFDSLRCRLIERYVDATPRDHQLALFLLNDIIRYWRTMTVDYMYKTVEGAKPWAIRNIKLVFSRKLMYASGLFSVAQTVDRSRCEKAEILLDLLSCPVTIRMEKVCGSEKVEKLFRHYAVFLEMIGDTSVRERLNKIRRDDHSDPTFRVLKNEGHHFTRELLELLETTFHRTHPIFRSVIF